MFFPPKTPDLHPLGPGLWEIGDAGINLYLIAGSERAIMLDTGFGSFVGLRALAEGLCGLPTLLVHTHAHGDHTGSDHEWAEAWLHPGEWARFRSDRGEGVRLLPLEDGQRFDLGGRTLEVIHVPGHSAGSVALLDRENRLLFSGDTVMTQPVFLFNPECSPADFLSSLDYLA
ncbi:MAG: MBL fold metallo-hydrolase [Oscillospiraceae bacterium]|nr:MBL fold metallo-hydrolase [Oscillospiraceae bacterium]